MPYLESMYPAIMAIIIVHIYLTIVNSKKIRDMETTIASLKKEVE